MATTTPSVVVASRQAATELRACLEALVPQCEAAGAQLIVARDPDAGPTDELLAGFPSVQLVLGPPGAPIPVLRGVGVRAAVGDPVALTEDHLLAPPGWLSGLVAALEPDWDAVGGGMANAARGRLVDWAAYFSDYGFYSIARPANGVLLLTAANIAYRRRVVGDVARWAIEGAWENVVHDRLAAAGGKLRFEPKVPMLHRHRYRLDDFLRNRFEHGRDYARSRLVEEPGTSAWGRALSAPLLVPVLFLRIARAAWREAPGAFWLSAPLTLALLAAWAVGEAVGYVGGPRINR